MIETQLTYHLTLSATSSNSGNKSTKNQFQFNST